MMQRCLLYILMVLTFIQSTDAIADAAKYHQPNSEYAETDYFPNQLFKSSSLDIDNNSSREGNEVDHCCSCHGITNILFLSNELVLNDTFLQNEITNSNVRYLSHLITPDIRPPIA